MGLNHLKPSFDSPKVALSYNSPSYNENCNRHRDKVIRALPVQFQCMRAYCVLVAKCWNTVGNVTDTVMAFSGLDSSNMAAKELLGKHLMRKVGIRITTCLLTSVSLALMHPCHPRCGFTKGTSTQKSPACYLLYLSPQFQCLSPQTVLRWKLLTLNFEILCICASMGD